MLKTVNNSSLSWTRSDHATNYLLGGSFLKLSSHLQLGLLSVLFLSGTTTEPLNSTYVPHSPLISFYLILSPENCLARGANRKYITQFSSFTCYYFHLGVKYFLNTVFSNTLDLCCSHKLRDNLTHPYKKEGRYCSVYLNFYIFGQQTVRQMILHGLLTGNS